MGFFKDKAKRFVFKFVYMLHEKKLIKNKLHVNEIDQTIDKLIHSEESFVRFGDAEIRIIEGNTTKFQDYDPALAERLYEILQYKQEHILVGIPDIFDSLGQYTDKSKGFWMEHLFFSRKTYLKYCNVDKVYENAFFSRLYYIYNTGVGNDLIDTAASVERIICPSLNAYLQYTEIRQACFTFERDKLFLLALGNTAKLLVSDLTREGYRAIDIGNLDIEYEWYLNKDDKKGEVKKHSIAGVEANKEAGYDAYLSQVKKRIV